jgi:hypothetical protein
MFTGGSPTKKDSEPKKGALIFVDFTVDNQLPGAGILLRLRTGGIFSTASMPFLCDLHIVALQVA